jgi:chlorobactene glucosyltransferase
MLLLFRIICSLITFGWCYACFRSIRAALKQKWTLTTTQSPASSETKISIVIPARNEERCVENVVRSCFAQDHNLENVEIIVLDDGSTDQTGAILKRLKDENALLTIIERNPETDDLPKGWFGKPWALQRAQKHATGEWLVFVDADVTLFPTAISRTIGYAQENKLDMLTGLGELEVQSFWERVMQPAVGAIILAGNSLSEVNDPTKKDKNLANGQFIAISRKAYDAIGQHQCVQQNILDDVGIARAVAAKDFHYHCLHLTHMFSCRMYTSFGEIWEGWTKNLFAGLRYSWGNLIGAVCFTLLFSVSGPLLLLLALALSWDIEFVYWGLAMTFPLQITRLVVDIRRKQPVIYGLTHSPASFIVCLIMINSAIKSSQGTVQWKNRTYQPNTDDAKEEV